MFYRVKYFYIFVFLLLEIVTSSATALKLKAYGNGHKKYATIKYTIFVTSANTNFKIQQSNGEIHGLPLSWNYFINTKSELSLHSSRMVAAHSSRLRTHFAPRLVCCTKYVEHSTGRRSSHLSH